MINFKNEFNGLRRIRPVYDDGRFSVEVGDSKNLFLGQHCEYVFSNESDARMAAELVEHVLSFVDEINERAENEYFNRLYPGKERTSKEFADGFIEAQRELLSAARKEDYVPF